MKKVTHWRSIRLYNNAGMNFPACYAGARLLDLDKGRLPTTGIRSEVSCKRCMRLVDAYERKMGISKPHLSKEAKP